MKLFCFPHAGGSASFYRGWRDGLADEIDVISVEYPGRGRRFGQPFETSFEGLADLLMEELKERFVGNFALFGHSLGGLIAFDLCRRLEVIGQAPTALMISACVPPHRQENFKRSLPGNEAQLHEYLERHGGTPSEILANGEMMTQILKAVRADLQVLESYRYRNGVKLKTPVFAYAGMDDTSVAFDDIRRWEDLAEQVSIAPFPGGHFFISDFVQRFLQRLSVDIRLVPRTASREGKLQASIWHSMARRRADG